MTATLAPRPLLALLALSAALSSTALAQDTWELVDVEGDCDAFGTNVPYSSNPSYYSTAVADGTDMDRHPGGWCFRDTVDWTHSFSLPEGATVVGATLQINTYGVQDSQSLYDNALYLDGVESVGAWDGIYAGATARADTFNVPVALLADGTLHVSMDPLAGTNVDCIWVDYAELVIEYAGDYTDSPLPGTCGQGTSPDSDGDGVTDNIDFCPAEDATGADVDGDGCVDTLDTDGDGVPDDQDLCLGADSSGDTDADGVCDDTDADIDGDGVSNGDDAFPGDPTEWADADGDGAGDNSDFCPTDAADTDDDDDGVCDVDDTCLGSADNDADADGDQVCDTNDLCWGNDITGDGDADGTCGDVDNCPVDANVDQADADADGIGDACEADSDQDGTIDDDDNCVGDYNVDQADNDADGLGDVCDADDDDDGVADADDNCALVANASQDDFDGDGQGDACDGDDDADAVGDGSDLCHATPLGELVNADGCSGTQFVELTCGTADTHPNHGSYVSCVAHATNQARSQGLVTGKQGGVIVSKAAKSKK